MAGTLEMFFSWEKKKKCDGVGKIRRSREVREFLILQSKSNVCLCIYEL